MSALPESKLSADEYLARERLANHKSEYYFGEVFARSGQTHACFSPAVSALSAPGRFIL